MSWDVGLMGTCPACGLRVHCAYEDHGEEPFWNYCHKCQKADVSIDDDAPCAACGGSLVEWDTRECPRCHQPVTWDPILAAN
jgi:hypothetical protein